MGHLAIPILFMILASAAVTVEMLVTGMILGPFQPGAVRSV